MCNLNISSGFLSRKSDDRAPAGSRLLRGFTRNHTWLLQGRIRQPVVQAQAQHALIFRPRTHRDGWQLAQPEPGADARRRGQGRGGKQTPSCSPRAGPWRGGIWGRLGHGGGWPGSGIFRHPLGFKARDSSEFNTPFRHGAGMGGSDEWLCITPFRRFSATKRISAGRGSAEGDAFPWIGPGHGKMLRFDSRTQGFIVGRGAGMDGSDGRLCTALFCRHFGSGRIGPGRVSAESDAFPPIGLGCGKMLRFDSRTQGFIGGERGFVGFCSCILGAAADGKLATPALGLHQVGQQFAQSELPVPDVPYVRPVAAARPGPGGGRR